MNRYLLSIVEYANINSGSYSRKSSYHKWIVRSRSNNFRFMSLLKILHYSIIKRNNLILTVKNTYYFSLQLRISNCLQNHEETPHSDGLFYSTFLFQNIEQLLLSHLAIRHIKAQSISQRCRDLIVSGHWQIWLEAKSPKINSVLAEQLATFSLICTQNKRELYALCFV